jgi:hypothetical protein
MPGLVIAPTPYVPFPVGAGLFVGGTFTGGAPSAGDIVRATLFHTGLLNYVARGTQLLDGTEGSWRVDFLDLNQPSFQEAPLDLELRWDSGGVTLYDHTIVGVYGNDSISSLWPAIALLGGGGGHDPMLDLIYAAVHKIFPTT